MPYCVVRNEDLAELIEEVNRLETEEGWLPSGNFVSALSPFGVVKYYQSMVRSSASLFPERYKIASEIAEAIENMSIGASFAIHGTNSMFEVTRKK